MESFKVGQKVIINGDTKGEIVDVVNHETYLVKYPSSFNGKPQTQQFNAQWLVSELTLTSKDEESNEDELSEAAQADRARVELEAEAQQVAEAERQRIAKEEAERKAAQPADSNGGTFTQQQIVDDKQQPSGPVDPTAPPSAPGN
jgi:hypothetical protein